MTHSKVCTVRQLSNHNIVFSVAKAYIRKTLKKRAPINHRNWDGITPLHWAAERGSLKLCQLIMAHIDEQNPMDNFGRTPEDLASGSGHTAVVKWFAENAKKHKCFICDSTFSQKNNLRRHMHNVHNN